MTMSRKAKATTIQRPATQTGHKHIDQEIIENILEGEQQKEKNLLNLIAEILVKATLRDLYETGN